jgi:hypothetical protein
VARRLQLHFRHEAVSHPYAIRPYGDLSRQEVSMKRIVLLGPALVAVAIALSIHLVTAGGSAARSGRVVVRHTDAVPVGSLVRGRVLSGFGRSNVALPLAASAPLVGNLGPVAAPSRDRRYIAYNTWRWTQPIDWQRSLDEQGIASGDPLGRPQLHLLDLRDGADTQFDPGSFSVAWRADGAIAYARGTPPDYRANTPFAADVVVRRAVEAAPTVWSATPGQYLVEGWAGRRLIVRAAAATGRGALVAFDAPGSERPLATDADLIAISPNGDEILVAESAADAAAPAVRLVSVADGTEEARTALAEIVDPVTRTPVSDVVGLGNWQGDRVVAASSSGLVVFRVSGRRLSVEQVLHVDTASRPGGGFYEPRFGDPDARTIVGWADLPATGGRESAQFTCDRYALTCTETAAVPSTRAPRPVYDPSGGNR